MIPNGFELHITNEYGFELDSFLGAIYLPWQGLSTYLGTLSLLLPPY